MAQALRFFLPRRDTAYAMATACLCGLPAFISALMLDLKPLLPGFAPRLSGIA
ncbi:MAG: hypothetical protein AAGL98_00240 [Planctomycetota bacterium]